MDFSKFFSGWQLECGASDLIIKSSISSISVQLPEDYLTFIKVFNGGEGFIGDGYLILWQVEQIEIFNKEYEVQEYAPGLILFGSSGGGEGYGFDARDISMPIVEVPFIGMELQYARRVAANFTDFLSGFPYE
jgi:hypothetical protein